ncbi:MAG: hypothetical protein ABIU63_00980 [Chitinophagaceae bacterium]
MDNGKGMQLISTLRGKWILYSVLGDGLVATGTGFLTGVLVCELTGWPAWWGIAYGVFILLVLLLVHQPWRVKASAIAALLNQTYPDAEESAELLLQLPASLNTLQQLQYKRTSDVLQTIDAPLSIHKKIWAPAFIMVMMLLTAIAINKLSVPAAKHAPSINHTTVIKKEIVLPQIAALQLFIRPPAYTARPARQQASFNLLAEEGSQAEWKIQTSVAAGQVSFIFNDTVRVKLRLTDAKHNQWQLSKKLDSSGFYQVNIDGKLSELYKIETIRDQLPVIEIQSPKQYTTIEYGEIPQVKITTLLSDDYGIKDAFIAATVASGNGEAVKFKEQKISLQGFAPGARQYRLQQSLLLSALAMQPGDELYFYVQATDNHLQQTRSDIHIVHLPDTAQLMSVEGLANSLTLKPEYFRSQRQIIIETEQLLKDKDTISMEAFKNRGNNLGIDQKLLRLRYGKFLGEESEPGEHGADEVDNIADFSNAEKVMDAFTDKHDIAEDASYYDPATKKQLRATLTEMWRAELHLRTFTPREALPFEYKALRLLKDLQQQSRAYVAKANFKTTPLDLKKRLTGELSKINQAVRQKNIVQQKDPQQVVRDALAVLDTIKSAGNADQQSREILQQANLRLHEKAVQQPSHYLHAVEALNNVLAKLDNNKTLRAQDVQAAQFGLQQLLATPDRMPSAGNGNLKQNLSKQYFNNLQNRQP